MRLILAELRGARRLHSDVVESRERIEARLRQALEGDPVEVVDESYLHRGHVGARSGGGHFRALVVSPRFRGASRIQRQRLVYDALAAMLPDEIHALSMRTLTPEEWIDESEKA